MLKRISLRVLSIVVWGILTSCGGGGNPAYAQVQNTLYQTLATNSTTTGLVVYGPIRNIGQSFHQVLLTLNGGAQCGQQSDPAITIVGSNANTYAADGKINFGVPVNNLAHAISAVYQGVGAYPFIYVTVSSTVLGMSCSYSILYSGSIQPIQPQNISLINVMINAAGTGSAALATGTNTFIGGTAGAQGTIRFYQAVASSDVATRVTFTCVSSGNVFVLDIPTSGTVVMPYTQVPYFSCPEVSAINSTVAAMTTVYFQSNFIIQR